MKIYLRILAFAKPYKWYVLISLLTSILYVITNGLSLWIIGSLLSSVMNSEPLVSSQSNSFTNTVNNFIFHFLDEDSKLSQLKFLSFTLLASFFLKNIFFYINNISLSYAQNGMITNIRNQIFRHLQKLSLSFFKNKKTAELTAITITDVNMLRMIFTQTVQNLFNQPLNVLFCMVTLFLINFKLALISFTIIPLSAFITIKLGASIRRKATRSSKQMAGMLNVALENITGIQVVKAFTKEKEQIDKFEYEGKHLFHRIFKLDSLKFLSTPINDMIGAAIGAVLLWYGGQQVLIDQTLTGDGFIKFFTFLFAMFTPAKKLANVNVEISRGIASAERVFTILDNDMLDDQDGNIEINEFNNELVFDNVVHKYDNNKEIILNNISVKIKKGEVIAIVGESGAGKTTFVDLIPRYFKVLKGSIKLDNININDINITSLRKQIGIVSQSSLLFNETIYENIKFGNPDASDEEIYKAAEVANASDFIEQFPNKYETVVGEKGGRVSGGQKQRIAIARAIVKNPNILILDEATSSLDSKSEQKIQDAMVNIIKDRTVIIIAHRLSTIRNASRILVFHKGEIVEQGNHEKLIKLNSRYQELCKIQFGERIN